MQVNYMLLSFMAVVVHTLAYCGPDTLFVSQDGRGHFSSIQAAVNAVPDFRPQRTIIAVGPGIYREKLVLPPNKTNVSLIGGDRTTTVVTYDDHAGKLNRFGEPMGTSSSSTFFVFGNGFYAQEITFENGAGPIGQAVAVRVSATRVFFNRCRFLGYQDTLYPELAGSKQYYKDCYIEGTTDFIFGAATAFFESCELHSKSGGRYITAASTPDTSRYGFVFKACRLTGVTADGRVYLGRPWRPYAKTVFIDCNLGGHIHPEGWNNWGRESNELTAYYAECNNSGKGADTANRVMWAHMLEGDKQEEFEKMLVLGGWIPAAH